MATQKLRIQTRKEFEEGLRVGYNYRKEEKREEKEKLESEIKRLQEEIKSKQQRILALKHQSFKSYKEENTYEKFVKNIRKTYSSEYEIIENKDSIKVVWEQFLKNCGVK